MESLGTGAQGGGRLFSPFLLFCLFALLPFCPFTFLLFCHFLFFYDTLTVEHQQGDGDDGEHTHTDV